MKLIIDRGQTKKGIYTFEFGPDFDILILHSEIKWNNKLIMAEIDKLITGSVDLKFCVLYLKHPFLLENNQNEFIFRKQIREYFTLRLIHRHFLVSLYEFGKRLF